MRSHPAIVRDFLEATLRAHREIAASSKQLALLGSDRLGLESGLLTELTEAYRKRRIWSPDGGMTRRSIQTTVDFFVGSGKVFNAGVDARRM